MVAPRTKWLGRNCAGFNRFQLLPRTLMDAANVSLATRVQGTRCTLKLLRNEITHTLILQGLNPGRGIPRPVDRYATGMSIAIITLLYHNHLNSHALHVEADSDGKVIRLQLCEEVSFLNKSEILRSLEALPDHGQVTLDASQCFVLDNDVAEILRKFLNQAHQRHIKVTLACSESALVKPGLQNGYNPG